MLQSRAQRIVKDNDIVYSLVKADFKDIMDYLINVKENTVVFPQVFVLLQVKGLVHTFLYLFINQK